MTAANQPIDYYPLSPLQHGMLFHSVQNGRSSGVDIEQLEAQLHEPIGEEAFSRAWASVAARHAVLRTRFRWEGLDSPRQEVLSSIPSPIGVRDVSSQTAAEQAVTFTTFLEADRRLGFDSPGAALASHPVPRVGPRLPNGVDLFACDS